MSLPSGSWMGSNVTSEDITQLRATRRLPRETDVGVRLPRGEQRPRPEGQERVVFLTHFERGFGLPASTFFRAFLEFFGLQPHHLGAGAIVQLSGFVTLCEGYLGVEPTIDLWARFFSLKQQGPSAGEFADCGAAVISKRSGADFPKIPLEDSAKKWQNSFFYVRNLGADRINLPAFAIAPPRAKTNWGYSPRRPSQEIVNLCERVTVMRTQEGLTGTDLLAAFIMRRVLPLQGRSCLIGEMVGLQDPNRMGSTRLSAEQIARGVNDISKANLGEDWRFGKAPYSQSNPAPQVSVWSSYFAAVHLLIRPDATRGVLLNAIRHPYARAPSQVAPVAPEEPAAHGGEEVAESDAGAGRRAGKSRVFLHVS